MANLWYLSPSDQNENIGIGSYGNEMEQMNKLLDAVIPHLERCGVQFHRASKSLGISKRPAESDKLNARYYLALHSNAGGGGQAWGPIAFYYEGGKSLAEKLIAELKATGQKSNRASSVQQNKNLFELNAPAATACLLEVDFHDSQTGVDFLVNHRADAAKAIAKAIVAIDGRTWSDAEPDTAPQTDKLYRVQAGAFAVRANAEKLVAQLKKDGYEAFITQ
ncbi:MAG TPA: N-acetylmuramoyl-L-alanine amidase [Candidatus Faecousia intestinigallinarum]|nr:N-acetylmuramoyl-L-alanine amidase [Candidatus Faecousia intestinigallinarum]